MTLFRAALRDLAVRILIAADTPCRARIASSRFWPRQQPADTEALIYVFRERKEGIADGTEPQFRTRPVLVVKVRTASASEDTTERQLDEACEAIEEALLGSPEFTREVEKITAVETEIEVKTEGAKTFGEATIAFEVQISERWQPVIAPVLEGLNLHIDASSPFDSNGTYTPPFDYSVQAAPRTSGPDGREELAAQIDLPQS